VQAQPTWKWREEVLALVGVALLCLLKNQKSKEIEDRYLGLAKLRRETEAPMVAVARIGLGK